MRLSWEEKLCRKINVTKFNFKEKQLKKSCTFAPCNKK